MAVYGAASYLAERDPLLEPAACLWVDSGVEGSHAQAIRAQHFPRLPLGPRCNGFLLQQAAVRAGIGITLLPCALGDADAALRRVGEPVDERDVWLLFHPDLRGVARIRSLSEHLQQAFSGLEPRLLGDPEAHSSDVDGL